MCLHMQGHGAGWADEEIHVHSHCSYTQNIIASFRKTDMRFPTQLQINLIKVSKNVCQKVHFFHVTQLNSLLKVSELVLWFSWELFWGLDQEKSSGVQNSPWQHTENPASSDVADSYMIRDTNDNDPLLSMLLVQRPMSTTPLLSEWTGTNYLFALQAPWALSYAICSCIKRQFDSAGLTFPLTQCIPLMQQQLPKQKVKT